jgi:hypothetical protein
MVPQNYTILTELDKEQLTKILNYKNEDVISRFTDMFNVSDVEAADIFTETQKFLFICQLKGIFIPDDLLIIDEMWHNFILFTKEYNSFCMVHFGKYFHHLPATKKEKEEQKKKNEANPEAAKEEYLKKLEHLISTAYDHLGEETVIKWFRDYPTRYSKENIKALRKI